MGERGMGGTYRPTYTDPKTGERKKAARWWIRYSVRGKTYREPGGEDGRGAVTREEARNKLKRRLAAHRGPAAQPVTVSEVMDLLVAEYETSRSPASAVVARRARRQMLAHLGGATRIHDLTRARLVAYAAERQRAIGLRRDRETGERLNVSPSTVMLELRMLRRAMHLAVPHRLEVAAIPPIPSLTETARSGFFTPAEVRALLRELPDRLRGVFTVAHITGWRVRSEILTRQWRHVDAGWLRIDPGEAKNREPRTFPLTPQLRAALEAQRARVREVEARLGRVIPWMFVHDDGRRIAGYRDAWISACDRAGLGARMVHDLRRTAVRNLEAAGVPRTVAMDLVGLKTDNIYRRYAIVDKKVREDAALLIEQLHQAQRLAGGDEDSS